MTAARVALAGGHDETLLARHVGAPPTHAAVLESLGALLVALDVFVAVALLSAFSLIGSSVGAALAGAAVLAGGALGRRSSSATLAVDPTVLGVLPRLAQIAANATLLLLAGTALLDGGAGSFAEATATWAVLLGALVVSHAAGAPLARRLIAPERALLVGSVDRCNAFRRSLEVGGNPGLAVVGRVELDDLGAPETGLRPIEALMAVHDATRIVVLDGDPGRCAQVARRARNAGARVTFAQEAFEAVGAPELIEHVGTSVLLSVSPAQLAGRTMVGKRTLDLVGACFVGVLLAPLLLVVAAAIRLTSRGPVLFWQERIGLDGHRFRIAKFRSMSMDAEQRKDGLRCANEASGGLFKIAEDPRVTPVGRLLRRTSLDELPQLINVIRGEMSLVGPRPLVGEEDALIGGWHRDRLRLKPGMTGRWQVLGSARIPLDEMVSLDQQYVASWSLWTDLRILAQTAAFVLLRRGM